MSIILFLLALVVVYSVAMTLVLYICWYYDRNNFPEQAKVPDEPPMRLWAAVLAMLGEAGSLLLLFLLYPLRLIHDASPVRTRHHAETPVILVHGYGGNSANFLLMQWRLKWRGWSNVYSVSYTPPHINARKLSQQVVDHVERILNATGAEKAHLVCHSMGGPLARYALKNLGLAGKVDKVITLGSPHYGSRVAALFPPVGAAAQLRYNSPFIRELANEETCPGGARYFSLYSNLDNFILPSSAAVLHGAEENVHVPYLGHASLLYSTRMLEEVERCLLKPEQTGE
ncbi:alpha/beta fold hydrolase [Alcanivorax sp. S6407]|uniref:lipase family alpha/beta hydrolase n=1 Tax=Alcanivorax sp. S6407 TaxID=2926424 RepID=UPI001FF6E441|nr:alpha/beta fold hydrolase [Alcanivorax sp. S6407]MCK0155442.1 alpha/beta fold hydrolase [Alcanivorax sp. S6407]